MTIDFSYQRRNDYVSKSYKMINKYIMFVYNRNTHFLCPDSKLDLLYMRWSFYFLVIANRCTSANSIIMEKTNSWRLINQWVDACSIFLFITKNGKFSTYYLKCIKRSYILVRSYKFITCSSKCNITYTECSLNHLDSTT